QVLFATNGEDGISTAHKSHPDLILLDIMMPGMDGYEVCRRLKTNPKTYSALNPRMTVYDILSEPLVIHNIGDAESRQKTVLELMALIGLDEHLLNRYPHSFSGGQRQRIVIARSLALNPDLLICDEPVSALDVSIQAQILNLLRDLQRGMGLTYLFISHNLAVVDYIADRIAVMCAGRLVELAPSQQLFKYPLHPYTKSLIAAVPYPDPGQPLDFSIVAAGRDSDPDAWDAPFIDNGSGEPALIPVGSGHFLRAHEVPGD
ncbi:MAG: ATP-binding cassette domain-containing protein, partial [Rhodospirillaceae bacterium]|nr:ATP-binding cassette domain-containing protein [Rhodospirillaceae bacterium]